ncbi:MAG: ABC transporter ATP-binding protein [Deinococcota bacterium]
MSKRFGENTLAVDALSLSLREGQFLALLGPSGCGKSTTLRLVAGLEHPDNGTINLAGVRVADARTWVTPEARQVGMVFQDYALFPHLTVAENIAFPLRISGSRQRRARVTELAALVGLADVTSRYPHQLSGGQQQRVALARALANDPTVILLDEPFSNLDAALRESTRAEVQRILNRTQATTILVTHDQDEALSMADVVAVMFAGKIVQSGTPQDIYLRPVSREVAAFVGAARFIAGQASEDSVICALGRLPLVQQCRGAVDILLRPEALTLEFDNVGEARVVACRFFGAYQLITVELVDGVRLEARLPPHIFVEVEASCSVRVVGPVMAYPSGAHRS